MLVGRNVDLGPTSMSSLEPYQDFLTIVSNTDCRMAEAFNPQEIGGDHFPYGLQLILNALTPAVHGGAPAEALNIDPILEALRDLIHDHLQGIDRAAIAPGEARGGVTADFVRDEFAIGALGDLEGSDIEALDEPEQESTRFAQWAVRLSDGRLRGSGGWAWGTVVAIAVTAASVFALTTTAAATALVPAATATAFSAPTAFSALAAVSPIASIVSLTAITRPSTLDRRFAIAPGRDDQRPAAQAGNLIVFKHFHDQGVGIHTEEADCLVERLFFSVRYKLVSFVLAVVHVLSPRRLVGDRRARRCGAARYLLCILRPIKS